MLTKSAYLNTESQLQFYIALYLRRRDQYIYVPPQEEKCQMYEYLHMEIWE
jgi:hypothetical protein